MIVRIFTHLGLPTRAPARRFDLKRILDIDIDHCSNCCGTLKITTVIEHPPLIVRILTHLSTLWGLELIQIA